MNQTHQVIETSDGSRTLFCNRSQQSFHSIHGAYTESRHVFLDGCQLEHLFQVQPAVSILEIGFGTGLNWLLTASLALRYPTNLVYTGLDREIPPSHYLSELSYQKHIDTPHLAESLLDWRKKFPVSVPCGSYKLPFHPKSILELRIDDIVQIDLPPHHYDRIYLDAFAPTVNPHLWEPIFIQTLYDSLQSGGILATYSCAGHVQRSLTASGFMVTRRPGPPGKRAVLSAQKDVQ